MSTAIGVAVLAAVFGPLLTYLAAARQLSGRVATSDASSLWAESASIREDYRTRITELNGVVDRCEKRIEELEKRNAELAKENNNLHNVIAKLEKELRRVTA